MLLYTAAFRTRFGAGELYDLTCTYDYVYTSDTIDAMTCIEARLKAHYARHYYRRRRTARLRYIRWGRAHAMEQTSCCSQLTS